jgi:hypothetical protein
LNVSWCFPVIWPIRWPSRKPPGWSWWRQFLVALVLIVFLTGLSGGLRSIWRSVRNDAACALRRAGLPNFHRIGADGDRGGGFAHSGNALLEWMPAGVEPPQRPQDRRSCRAAPPDRASMPAKAASGAASTAGLTVSAMARFRGWCNWPGTGAMSPCRSPCAMVMVLAIGLARSGRVEFVFFPSPEAENISGTVVFNAGLPEDRRSGGHRCL